MDIYAFIMTKDPNVVNHGGLITYVDDNLTQTISVSEMSPRFRKIYLYKSKELVSLEI